MTVIDLTVIFPVVFLFLDKRSKLSCCFIEASSVINREITTVLKIAVDNVILELFDSCDYFANPLFLKKNQLNLIVILKEEICKL